MANTGPGEGRFLGSEQSRRGTSIGSGKKVMPKPTFTQPDNGVMSSGGIKLTATTDPTTKRRKSENVTKDLRAGLY